MIELIDRVIEGGNKRIIGEKKYVISAVLIAISRLNGKECVILEKRASNIRQGGEISFPGGKFDTTDITTENTAVRECVEELGVANEKIKMIGKFGTLVNPSGMILEVYVGYIDIESIEELNYNRAEVERVLSVPLKFFIETEPRVEKIGVENIPMFSIQELRLPKRYGKSWSGNPRDVYFYNFEGEVIWGMTAEILYEFVQSLKKIK